MKKLKLAACIAAFLAACSCTAQPYVDADALTFKAIAPEYVRYVAADPALDAEKRDRRLATVRTWAERINAQGAQVEVPEAPR